MKQSSLCIVRRHFSLKYGMCCSAMQQFVLVIAWAKPAVPMRSSVEERLWYVIYVLKANVYVSKILP